MVSTRERKINGKSYTYLEHSFRLPSGKVKKISAIQKPSFNESYFLEKEILANIKEDLERFSTDSVFLKEKISKLTQYRVKYKHILRKLTRLQKKDLIDRFSVNFTYESNAIEGNSLTLKDVTFILQENKIPEGKELREVHETRNTKEVNELLFSNQIKITLPWIKKVQAILIRDTGVFVGYKRVPNFLIGRDVKTTPPENVKNELSNLVEWYQSTKNHPVRIASEFHGRFGKIHPFEDGNGRVGRVLINAILLQHKFPPLIIRKTMRMSYFTALSAFDNKHKNKLERFLIEMLEKTFEKFFEVYVKYL